MWRHKLIQLQFFKGEWVCGGVIGRRGRWKGGGPAQRRCCVCAARPAGLKAGRAISHCEWSTNGDELRGTDAARRRDPFDSAERCPDVGAAQLIVLFILGCFHLLPWPAEKSLDWEEFFYDWNLCPLSFPSLLMLLNSWTCFQNQNLLVKEFTVQ